MNKNDLIRSIIYKKLNKNFEIKIDSREILEHDIFIAIRGGNKFIREVLDKGASIVIYDDKNFEIKNEKVFLVENSIEFLQDLSRAYLKEINPITIGITGSNGKTTTKDILFTLLSQKYKGKKTIGNYNNHIGLPLSIMNLEKDDDFIVLEMGMSNFGEIRLLAEISRPDYAIITNIGDSHLEYLKTRENVFKAKTELIEFLKKDLFVNGDDFYLKDLNAIKVGFSENNDFIAKDVLINKDGSFYTLKNKDKEYKIFLNLFGEHNILDSMLAIALSLKLEININDIIEVLKNISVEKMRFQKIEIDNNIFINDAYNASPVSMNYSIETFSKIYENKDLIKIAVLGDMLELGENSKKFHEDISKILNKIDLDYLFLYGKEMKHLYLKINNIKNLFYCETKKEIKEKINLIEGKKIILLKASRGMKLEEIIE